MKAYWDAGLKQLASASDDFRGETLTSLSKCSSYSITTSFLFEVWEALYTHINNLPATKKVQINRQHTQVRKNEHQTLS